MAGQWRVVGQRQYEELTGAGTFVATVEITFELAGSGTVGTVKIPQRQYTEEYVRAEIDRVAGTMIAVENL